MGATWRHETAEGVLLFLAAVKQTVTGDYVRILGPVLRIHLLHYAPRGPHFNSTDGSCTHTKKLHQVPAAYYAFSTLCQPSLSLRIKYNLFCGCAGKKSCLG
jgi:hypothetical protein